MANIQITTANHVKVCQDALADFKAYVDKMLKSSPLVIRYSSKIVGPSDSDIEATFQFGDSNTWITSDRTTGVYATQNLIFPALEYALTLKDQYKLHHKSSVSKDGTERAVITGSSLTTSYFA